MFDRECALKLKKSYQHFFFGYSVYAMIRAKDAERILSSAKYNEKSFLYGFLHPLLKTGLLTSAGDKWHARRRMLTPAFHFNILKEFFEVFREESDKLVAILERNAGKSVNVIPIATQFTLNTVCESAMGVKLSNLGTDGVAYHHNINEFSVLFMERIMRPWLYPDFFYKLFGGRAKLDKVLEPIHSFTRSIIKERKANFKIDTKTVDDKSANDENVYFRSKKRRYAMMDTLLKAQSDGLIDDEGIIEETDTFTFEGHDTTSSAVTFTLLLLAHNPEAQEKIFEEIQNVKGGENDRELTIDDFNKMDYLDRVLKESMRIYPPVPSISRVNTEDFEYDGVTHKKGTTLQIHIFDVHRDPEVFPDPEKFDPDRFLPENCIGRNNFAYIAFSAGMRNCIGQKFALLELKVAFTKIIEKFKILPVTKREEVRFILDLILRSKYPIEMKFEKR